MSSKIYFFCFLAIFACIVSCKKSGYLSARPDQSLVIPETLEDLQALLDNTNVFNGDGQGLTPVIAEIAADNYYALNFGSSSSAPYYRAIYLWNHQINKPNETRFFDWDNPYRAIFYANVALEGLQKVEILTGEESAYNNILGNVLFHKAHMYYQLAQVFTPPYEEATADSQLGLPLRETSDVNERMVRSSLQETYDTILSYLKTSVNLLPDIPKYKARASKPAAYALLARVYQTMLQYDSSLFYASKCLELFNTLIDYNDNSLVNTTGSVGIRIRYNPEIIFNCRMEASSGSNFMYLSSALRVDTTLYSTYDVNDLRSVVFFRTVSQGAAFKGSYESNNRQQFTGIAADEVYLIRAECYARKNMVAEAMGDLNALLIKRWKDGNFTPLTAASADEALNLVLAERRKELIFRGLRWTDIRRLNTEGANITLTRIVDGVTYQLQPNDLRFTYLIPFDAISFNPGWPQNLR